MWNRLWNDEAGFVVSTELILIATVLVIGMLVGLATLRDQVVQELADVAAAISDVDQSYAYTGILGHTAQTAGSNYEDAVDFCDDAADQAAITNHCISMQEAPSEEG